MLQGTMNIELRQVSAEHQDFLYRVYASTRQAEIAAFGWDPAQQEAFLRMQFNAQQRSYEMVYEGADHKLVFVDGQPAGRILVHRGAKACVLVDIALLAEYRNRGIGRQLLQQLLDDAGRDGIAVRLQVLKTNPAYRLYERLGFVKTGEDGIYFQMEKSSS